MSKSNKYGDDSITEQSALETCRKNLPIFFGSTDIQGAFHSIKEILSNSVDEEKVKDIKDRGTIKLTIHKDNSVTIEDDGRGLPLDWNKKLNRWNWQSVLCQLHSGGKFEDNRDNFKNSTGMNGLGLAVTAMSSAWIKIESRYGGNIYNVELKKGAPIESNPDKVLKKSKDPKGKDQKTGTTISWKCDTDEVYLDDNFDLEALKEWCKTQAILTDGTSVVLKDERANFTETYKYEDGIKTFAEESIGKDVPMIEFTAKGNGKDAAKFKSYDVECRVLFAFTDKKPDSFYYHNSLPLTLGGSPQKAEQNAFLDFFQKQTKNKKLEFSDIQENLFYISNTLTQISPTFRNQTKDAIDMPFIEQFLTGKLTKQLADWAKENPLELEKAIKQVEANSQARLTSATVKQMTKEKLSGKIKLSDKIDKLTECRSKDVNQNMVFFVEGDSAAGTIRNSRDPEFQAVYALRGKPKNVYKMNLGDILDAPILTNILKIFGTGIDMRDSKKQNKIGDFNIDNRRFGKFVIACFTGDTKVKALDGHSYSFKELVDSDRKELWIYAMDAEGNMKPALAKNIRQTGTTKELIKITLDNGKEITCTPDHLFLTTDNEYVRADKLTEDTHLMPLYTRNGDEYSNYEQYYDSNSGKWLKTYQEVAKNVYPEEIKEARKRFEEERKNGISYKGQRGVVIHHKDFNKDNNSPENLLPMTGHEHSSMHGELLVRLNRTEKHREQIRQHHFDGTYDDIHFGGAKNNYNGSEEQKEKLKEKHKNGVYNDVYFGGSRNNYNFSEKHNEVIKKVNQSKKHIDSCKLSAGLKSIYYMLMNNLPIDENTYRVYSQSFSPKYKELLALFDNSVDKLINEALNKAYDITNYIPRYVADSSGNMHGRGYDNSKKQRTQISKVIHQLIKDDLEISEENYNKVKGGRTPNWNSITNWYNSYEDAIEAGKYFNHNIVGIEHIHLDKEEPVYCMSVDNYHNFLLDAGVFVKNCDQDIDGLHIACLIITICYTLMPELIKQGYLYRLETPLYMIQTPDGELDCYSDEEKAVVEKKYGNKIKKISRFKGLGEFNEDQFARFLQPDNMKLTQYTMDDAQKALKAVELWMGNDPDPRKKYINEHSAECKDLELGE